MPQHSLAGNHRLKKDAFTRVQLIVWAFRERKLCGRHNSRVIHPLLAPQPLRFSAVLFTSGLSLTPKA
jgi:hypothetical protein